MEYEQESVRLNADNLKAMAHPLRVQILGQLRTHGPATASGLAGRLGLTSGALSYHLRQLERFGFIAEDAGRGDNRDRWWRAVHRYTEFDNLDVDPALAEIGDDYERSVVAALSSSLAKAQAERRSWPAEWQRAFDMSDTLLQLSAPETEELAAEIREIFARYRRHTPGDPVPADRQIVGARYQVYPVFPDQPDRADEPGRPHHPAAQRTGEGER